MLLFKTYRYNRSFALLLHILTYTVLACISFVRHSTNETTTQFTPEGSRYSRLKPIVTSDNLPHLQSVCKFVFPLCFVYRNTPFS